MGRRSQDRKWSLRVVITSAIAFLVALALGSAASLVLVTTKTSQIIAELDAAIESARMAHGLEIALLIHSREMNRMPRTTGAIQEFTEAEKMIHYRLAEIPRYSASSEEDALIEDVRLRVHSYLSAQQAAERVGRSAEAVEKVREWFDMALSRLEELVTLNVSQARHSSAQANRWDRLARSLGVSVAVLLSAGALAVLVWLWGFALDPLITLSRAMERFSRGYRDARAPERGAREMREMIQRFNAMADSLQQERENQLTFLSSVAHDLRNPLSALKLSTALLERAKERLQGRQVEKTLDIMVRQVETVDRMIGDLLDATRIEAGKLELHQSAWDVRNIVRDIVDLYLADDQHTITLSLCEEPRWALCDSMRIGQVLHNLISNASKYSPAGSPIHVEVTGNEKEVVVLVTDHGIGIDRFDLDRIFEPFRRTSSARAQAGGVGLGLSVSRRIVEAHEGHIEVESVPGRGSTFRVVLPQLEASHPRGEGAEVTQFASHQ